MLIPVNERTGFYRLFEWSKMAICTPAGIGVGGSLLPGVLKNVKELIISCS
jgi:hypothetical protein